MRSIVDQKALDDFLRHADAEEARKAAAHLDLMAACARLAAAELEDKRRPAPVLRSVASRE